MPAVKVTGLLFLLCLTASAAGSGYFPLETGNQWVYRCSGLCGDTLPVLSISKEAVYDGRHYWLFKGFSGGEAWLREDDQGVLWAYAPATGVENQWYAFLTAEGGSFATSVDPCSTSATLASRNYPFEGPAGSYPGSLRIVYPLGPCRDAGLSEEFFGRGVGLLRRTDTTIAGPRTYDLIYARTGGTTMVAQPELQFSLTLDRSVYTANLMPPIDPQTSIPQMTARLTLRNTTSQPLVLTFGSGQRYDLQLKNEGGEVVYRWSDGKMFTMAFGQERYGPGETNYTIVNKLSGKDGKPLPAGTYVAEGWITCSEPGPYRATVGFEVRHVY